MQAFPATRDMVLVGGGHAHALVLLDWAMKPLAGARLTLIDPNPVAPYTGMLPGLIAGHYPREALEMELVQLARHAGARLILGRAEGLDPVAGKVYVAGRPPVGFDLLSLDIGITSDLPDLPGFDLHGVSAKPLGAYAERWATFLDDVGEGRSPPDVVVIGGGAGGVELALAMAHRLRHRADRRIVLIERESQILQGLSVRARRRMARHFEASGIRCMTGASVASIDAGNVRLSDGRCIPAALTVAAAGARPQQWLARTGLHLTNGYVSVDPTLASISHEMIFAVGDCAHLMHAPRPKAGVFAVRSAPILAHNLRAALSGGSARRFRPQRDYLKLISLGHSAALGEKWGVVAEGEWLWSLKDRIDRRFMRMFHDLPAMPVHAIPHPSAKGLQEMLGEKPLCGGCGAKVGPATLRQALVDLPAVREDVGVGAGDDAAVLKIGGARQVIATDHLRAVTDDPWLMARIAAVHALGDIWAMGAAPQAALLSLILPRQPEAMQSRMLAEILAGAGLVTAAAGATIAGGHTTLGEETTIGLTVTGLVTGRLLTKGGAQPGDSLILTKPIGSGTLLAAEMQKRASGRDIAALWALLTQAQGNAAMILAQDAHAMTDVTGFGLAGHLDEMLRAGGVAADVELASIPVMDGAEDLAAAGFASTIAPANRAALIGRIDAPRTARTALLYDPQTAGGLLAVVPAEAAARLVDSLRDAGYPAAVIGSIRAADAQPALRVR
ncbi:selenide, water dikinase SelD [Pararhodobacter sp. SW119]|uniref:selenide, water dikinase SelD n=1 Tax=Pararhodobacter sp. SW119 TaxID=2780075 RepID=UPI001ADF866A|nr:selenide, water dikinase SelD [Pararhodobacter sp. SW119]